MNKKEKCEYCGKEFLQVARHWRGCADKKKVEYWLERKYVYFHNKQTWISGACKIFLFLRKTKYTSDRSHLYFLRKKELFDDLKQAKEYLAWERENKIKLSYDVDKDNLTFKSME